MLQQKPAAEIQLILDQTRSSAAGLSDLFDLAKLLLTRRELENRIRSLGATDLADLRANRATSELRRFYLAAEECFPEARELAQTLESGSALSSSAPGGPLICYETLLTLTEILFALEQSWFDPTKSGIRAADAKPIAQKLHSTTGEVQARFQIAMLAGLVTEHQGRWAATAKAQQWLKLERAQAWLQLVRAIFDLPPGNYPEGQISQTLAAEYPLTNQQDLKLLKYGHLLGLIDSGSLLYPISQPNEKLAETVIASLPKPEDRLLLQSDLSIICPGPISPALHRQLDSFADSEELGLASRFRISPLSLSHHLETGGQLSDVTNVLQRFGNKELPQPMQYLLAATEKTFGQLKIARNQKTLISSADPILLAQIANEKSLAHLGLTRVETGLSTNANQEMTYFSLRAASYAAIMVDQRGEVISPRLAAPAIEAIESEDESRIRAEQLIAGDQAHGFEGDIRRQLQFALKNKMQVEVSFEDAQGKTRIVKLMPLGITESRLRGRDVEREAEQTLPLGRIKSVVLD